MDVYKVNISYEDLLIQYKHNLTDYIRVTYQYLKDLYDRSLLLEAGLTDVKKIIEVYCNNYLVFRIKVSDDVYRIFFTNYVTHTADRIIVPEEIEFFDFSVIVKYTKEQILYSVHDLHVADFIYRGDGPDESFDIDRHWVMSYNIVVGEADGVTEEDKIRKIGYCDVIKLSIDEWSMELPQYKVRHASKFCLDYMLPLDNKYLERITDWISGTKIDIEVILYFRLFHCEQGKFLVDYMNCEKGIIKLIKTCFAGGVGSLSFITVLGNSRDYEIFHSFSGTKEEVEKIRSTFRI